MKGIRKKVLLGFFLLGCLLLLAGFITYVEFTRIGRSTLDVVSNGSRSVEIAKNMLDEADRSRESVLALLPADPQRMASMTVYDDTDAFDRLLTEARILFPRSAQLDTVRNARNRYDAVLPHAKDSLLQPSLNWYTHTYKSSYNQLVESVKEFMIAAQQTTEIQTAELEDKTYRAIMPGTVAIVVAFVILIVFFFMIDIYILAPVHNLAGSLRSFLSGRDYPALKFNGSDEVARLKEYIDQLVLMVKSRKKE